MNVCLNSTEMTIFPKIDTSFKNTIILNGIKNISLLDSVWTVLKKQQTDFIRKEIGLREKTKIRIGFLIGSNVRFRQQIDSYKMKAIYLYCERIYGSISFSVKEDVCNVYTTWPVVKCYSTPTYHHKIIDKNILLSVPSSLE